MFSKGKRKETRRKGPARGTSKRRPVRGTGLRTGFRRRFAKPCYGMRVAKRGGGGAGRRISKADQEGESVKTASNGSIGGGGRGRWPGGGTKNRGRMGTPERRVSKKLAEWSEEVSQTSGHERRNAC